VLFSFVYNLFALLGRKATFTHPLEAMSVPQVNVHVMRLAIIFTCSSPLFGSRRLKPMTKFWSEMVYQ